MWIDADFCARHHACYLRDHLESLFPYPRPLHAVLTLDAGPWRDVPVLHRLWVATCPGLLPMSVLQPWIARVYRRWLDLLQVNDEFTRGLIPILESAAVDEDYALAFQTRFLGLPSFTSTAMAYSVYPARDIVCAIEQLITASRDRGKHYRLLSCFKRIAHHCHEAKHEAWWAVCDPGHRSLSDMPRDVANAEEIEYQQQITDLLSVLDCHESKLAAV